MKKLIIYFAVVGLFTASTFGCKKDNPEPVTETRTTVPADSGTVNFTCVFHYSWQYEIQHTLGLGYNIIDINNQSYFTSKNWKSQVGIYDTVSYSFKLPTGVYYYIDKAYCQSGACTSDPVMATPHTKQGSFNITTNQTVNVDTYINGDF